MSKNKTYDRLGTLSIDEVLPFVITNPILNELHKLKGITVAERDLAFHKEFLGASIKLTSQRYRVFKQYGTKCVKCGIEGKYFAVERHKHSTSDKYHLNLYAVTNNGTEIMMTKDHVLPKSKGGKNSLSNYQPMCMNCNLKKGNDLESDLVELRARRLKDLHKSSGLSKDRSVRA